MKYALKCPTAAAMTLLLAAATGFTSCESFYVDEGDCDPHYFVRYIYDMNMEWADAFSSQVNSVDLYVFDSQTGEIAGHFTEKDMATLAAPGYLMPIDLKPGEYEFIAWCGMENNQENLFRLTEPSISNHNHIHCTLDRQYDGDKAFQDKQLHGLFHGKITATLPDEQGTHIVDVKLIRDTNNINLSMQHIAGQPLTSDMFSVTMNEGNGHLAHDNSLMEDEPIEFRPWHVRDGSVDITGTKGDGDSENLNYFMAELSTSRLMANRDPRINIVENATGNTVYSIPLVQWAIAFRSQQYKDNNNNMHTITDDQEYLDRESDYNIMLYLDNKEDGGWVAASIYINSWKVVLQGTDLD